MTGSAPVGTADATAIQDQVAMIRARLLDGRGTGVSQTEFHEHTRGRIVLGGEPTSQHLAAVARQTAIAGATPRPSPSTSPRRGNTFTATVQATTETIHDPASPSRFAARRAAG